MKSFKAYLAEADTEYEYKLETLVNIHSPYTMDRIELGLKSYGLITYEDMGVVSGPDFENPSFPKNPLRPIYVTKLIFKQLVDTDVLRSVIAAYGQLKECYIRVTLDGSEVLDLQSYDEQIILNRDPAAEAGQGAIDAAIEYYKADSKEKKNRFERPVYESVVGSHIEIEKLTGKPARRGFYLIKRINENYAPARISGPFSHIPDNGPYLGSVKASLTESKSALVITEGLMVRVTDKASGKVYHIATETSKPEDAISEAITIAANDYDLDRPNIIATIDK